MQRLLEQAENVRRDDKRRSVRRQKHYEAHIGIYIDDDAYTRAIEIGAIIYTSYPNNEVCMALQRTVGDFALDLYRKHRSDHEEGQIEGSQRALEDLQQLYQMLDEANENFQEGVRVNKIVRLLWANRSMESE